MKKKKTFSRLSVCLVCAAMAVATAVGGVSVFSKKEKADAAIGELNTMDEFTIAGFGKRFTYGKREGSSSCNLRQIFATD